MKSSNDHSLKCHASHWLYNWPTAKFWFMQTLKEVPDRQLLIGMAFYLFYCWQSMFGDLFLLWVVWWLKLCVIHIPFKRCNLTCLGLRWDHINASLHQWWCLASRGKCLLLQPMSSLSCCLAFHMLRSGHVNVAFYQSWHCVYLGRCFRVEPLLYTCCILTCSRIWCGPWTSVLLLGRWLG